jgi:uncharacterized phosphosugar-binding protein
MAGMGSETNAYLTAARALLERLESQVGAIEAASTICADAISGGGVVHCFGTGHSRIPVEEMFPRYGSYPGFIPLVELSLTFHTQVVGANGQRQAMYLERVEGLAATILANFRLRATDALMVFSVGGTTAVPIEMAQLAREQGLPVITVTSVEHSRASASQHSSGTRLADHADVGRRSSSPRAASCRRSSRPRRSSARRSRPAASTPRTPSTPDATPRRFAPTSAPRVGRRSRSPVPRAPHET